MAVVAFLRPEHSPPLGEIAIGPTESEIRLRIYGSFLSRFFLAALLFHAIQAAAIEVSLFAHFRWGIVAGEVNGEMIFNIWSPLDFVSDDQTSSLFHPKFYPLSTCLLASPILIFQQLPFALFLWFLSRLFGLYAQGKIFGNQDAFIMRKISYSLVAMGLLPLPLFPLAHWLGIYSHGFVLNMSMLSCVFLGLVLLAIAHVLEIGSLMRREQEGIL